MRKVHPTAIKTLGQSSLSRQLLNLNRRLAQENARDRQANTLEDLAGELGEVDTGTLNANAVFGGGDGLLHSEDGIYLYGSGTLLELSDGDDFAAIGINEREIFQVLYFKTTGEASLLTNGSFDTEDFTGWMDSYNATIGEGRNSQPAAVLSVDSQSLAAVISDKCAVTAGEKYLYSGYVARLNDAASQVTLYVRFYDAADTLLETVSFRLHTESVGRWARFYKAMTAPIGATQAAVSITAQAAGLQILWAADELALTRIFSYQYLSLPGSGYLNYGAAVTDGVGRDGTSGSTYSTQTMVLRVLGDAIRVSGFSWHIRNSGSYQLRHTWSGDADDSYKTLWAGTAPGTSEVDIPLDAPLVLTRGVHYFSLYRTTGPATVYTQSGTFTAADGMFKFHNAYYGGSQGSSLAPATVTYEPAAWT